MEDVPAERPPRLFGRLVQERVAADPAVVVVGEDLIPWRHYSQMVAENMTFTQYGKYGTGCQNQRTSG